MSERISLQLLGRHLLRECEKLTTASKLRTRIASVNVKEIEITLPIAVADNSSPPIIAIGEREPLLLTEALQQLNHLDTKATVSATKVANRPTESISQFKLRLRF